MPLEKKERKKKVVRRKMKKKKTFSFNNVSFLINGQKYLQRTSAPDADTRKMKLCT